MIAGALSDVTGVAGKVFTEGGRVLSEMGSRGKTNTDRNQNTDSTIGDAFNSIHDEHYAGDGTGGSGAGADSGPRGGSSGDGSDSGSLSSETQAEQAEDARPDGEDGSGGDPVDVVSGEMFLVQQDLLLPGVLSLALERRFASGYRRGRFFGARWSSTLDQRIEIDEEGIHVAAADGRVLHYPVPAVHGQQVMPSFGPRWPLVWDRAEGRDEVRIEQGDLGRTLGFLPGPVPQICRPLSAVVDRGGNRYTFVYDAEGVPTDIYHSGGYHLRMASVQTRGGARISAVTLADPGGGADLPVREFRYDRAGSLIEIRHPDSALPLVFEYDQDDRITAWTDRNGHWYRYTYRPDGRVATAVGEDGFLSATFDYDLGARTTTTTDALGHVRVYHWNALGQSVKMVDPLGGELHTEQDHNGLVLANTDQLGRSRTIARNSSGDPVRIANPDGSSTLIDYDERRLPVRAAHSDGRVWSYEHGVHGKVTVITNPLGAVMRFEHDEQGRLVRTTDPLGAATAYRCDAAGLPLEITDALGAVTVLRRDAFGRIVETTDAAGASTGYDWSPGGRLVRTRYPDGAPCPARPGSGVSAGMRMAACAGPPSPAATSGITLTTRSGAGSASPIRIPTARYWRPSDSTGTARAWPRRPPPIRTGASPYAPGITSPEASPRSPSPAAVGQSRRRNPRSTPNSTRSSPTWSAPPPKWSLPKASWPGTPRPRSGERVSPPPEARPNARCASPASTTTPKPGSTTTCTANTTRTWAPT
jgi:YD repeat-containing protein